MCVAHCSQFLKQKELDEVSARIPKGETQKVFSLPTKTNGQGKNQVDVYAWEGF